MGFTEAVRNALSKYVDFNGRAPRSEFWWFVLFCVGLRIVLGMFDTILGSGLLSTLAGLALLLPTIAVTARRLHDMAQSAWWCLLWLIPVIGWIGLLIWCAMPGSPGANRFGNDPLDPDAMPY